MQKELQKTPMTRAAPGPLVLVLAPTRELAMQTADLCAKFVAESGMSVHCIYGGVDKQPQVQALNKVRIWFLVCLVFFTCIFPSPPPLSLPLPLNP